MSKKHESDLIKGALAGLAAGIIATAAKTAIEKIYPPRTHGEPEPPVALAEKVAGHSLSFTKRTAAGESIHWGFGALAGAAYGTIVEVYPEASAKSGAAFGLTLNTVTHEGLLPALHLAASPAEQQPREIRSEVVSHVVYGVTTELVRRVIRRML